jgi:hypothetical protein
MRRIWFLAALIWLPGCESAETIAIAGNYVEKFMDTVVTEHSITADSWSQTFVGPMGTTIVYALGEFDNDTKYVLASIAADDGTTTWSRFDWTEHDGKTWYCTSVFGATSEADAKAGSADASDPANGGCGMFGWSALEAQ